MLFDIGHAGNRKYILVSVNSETQHRTEGNRFENGSVGLPQHWRAWQVQMLCRCPGRGVSLSVWMSHCLCQNDATANFYQHKNLTVSAMY